MPQGIYSFIPITGEAGSYLAGREASTQRNLDTGSACYPDTFIRAQRVACPNKRICSQESLISGSLVETFHSSRFTLYFLGVTLHCRSRFTLAHSCWLFIELTTSYFSQNTGLFAGSLKTTQRDIKRFVFFHFNIWHAEIFTPLRRVRILAATKTKSKTQKRLLQVFVPSDATLSGYVPTGIERCLGTGTIYSTHREHEDTKTRANAKGKSN